MIPLHYRQELVGYLSLFRNEIDTGTFWAGTFDPDNRQLYPRISFNLWLESKQGQAQQWTDTEIELAIEISKHFASAIHQYELYQQVQSFNETLEKQVHKRILEMQKTGEQQQALFAVINRIRESIDTDTMFTTTTKEVSQLIKSDRVSLYKFNTDWVGEFVGDFDATSTKYLDKSKLGINTIWNDTYLQGTQGGRYRNNETYSVDDIYKMGFTPCHIDNLKQFHIYAFVLAPIFISKKLWGLLCTYQHAGPRQWTTSEVNSISQIAGQLGVVIQQAELLVETQQHAEQLTQTLHELETTQTQLIQTEKMYSLGQLVAGVAHEINNPVNFISGNLTHIHEYAKNLLIMLNLHQQELTNPSKNILDKSEQIDLEFLMEDLPKSLSSMKIGVDRIRQIVLSLRNFSRLDESEMKDVNIHDCIDSTLLILQNRLKAKPESPGIELIKEYGDLPLVACYAGEINQVFMNILCNAIDTLETSKTYTLENPKPGRITISTTVGVINDTVNSAVIRIGDNASGIPSAIRDRIFDPCFTTKPVGKGTDLGL